MSTSKVLPTLLVVLTLWSVGATATAWYLRRDNASYQTQLKESETKLHATLRERRPRDVGPATANPTVIRITNEVAAAADSAAERRIQQLEAALRERDAQVADLKGQPTTNRPPRTSGPWDGTAWLDNLKKTNPEEYEAFMKRREEQRERTRRAYAEKADHFLKRDTSKMDKEQQEAHAAMLTLLDQTWALSEKLRTDIAGNDRREVVMAMRENIDKLSPMLDNERDNEFYQTGRSLGLSDAEAAQFVEQMNDVVDITSVRPLLDGMRGGGHGGGPPGGR